jgi:hypothetical protein
MLHNVRVSKHLPFPEYATEIASVYAEDRLFLHNHHLDRADQMKQIGC